MQPLQLFYNGASLHASGTVSIVSQRSEFSPNDFPQKETRDLAVVIDTFANDAGYNYDTLYANIKAARDALAVQNAVLKWVSPGDTTAGATLLERPVTVVSCEFPEETSWGIYRQQIKVTFRYELDHADVAGALTATVTGSGGTPAAISLGQVHQFKDDYANSFYSEWKRIRRRSSGTLSCSGELYRGLGKTGFATDTRRLASILADLTALKAQLTAGRYITLTYGPPENRVFNREVKIEAFNADMAQGPKLGVIKWNLTCSYTLFPNEAGFAAAEFTSSVSRDQQTGIDTLNLSGRILAGTEALAVAKLSTVTNAMQTAYGFAATTQTRREVSKNWVNSDDTQSGVATTNDGAAVAKTEFLELNFNLSYEKKAANILSYTLTVTDADDLRSGLITRTYSGSVIASGATEEAGYQAALTQARALGNAKHPFRVSATETRQDRRMASQGAIEFLRVEFQYVYQLKGSRVYLELSTSVSNDTFGESTERVSGFVVAVNLAEANAQYQTLVRSLYNGRLIRNETLDESQQKVQLGAGSGEGILPWYTGSGFTTMPIKLDFSLNVYKAKDTGTYAIKYGVRVALDYVALTQSTSVDGVFVGDAAFLAAIEAGEENPLETFLATLTASYGSQISYETSYDKEKVNAGNSQTINLRFTGQYIKALSTEDQVLRCSLSEDITYSGVRNVTQANPDGASVIQDCGLTEGQRSVSGSVTCATETAGRTWIAKQHGNLGLWQNWTDTKPDDADRYEEPIQIATRFEFIPLTDGLARGQNENLQVCELQFTFKELVPNLPAPF